MNVVPWPLSGVNAPPPNLSANAAPGFALAIDAAMSAPAVRVSDTDPNIAASLSLPAPASPALPLETGTALRPGLLVRSSPVSLPGSALIGMTPPDFGETAPTTVEPVIGDAPAMDGRVIQDGRQPAAAIPAGESPPPPADCGADAASGSNEGPMLAPADGQVPENVVDRLPQPAIDGARAEVPTTPPLAATPAQNEIAAPTTSSVRPSRAPETTDTAGADKGAAARSRREPARARASDAAPAAPSQPQSFALPFPVAPAAIPIDTPASSAAADQIGRAAVDIDASPAPLPEAHADLAVATSGAGAAEVPLTGLPGTGDGSAQTDGFGQAVRAAAATGAHPVGRATGAVEPEIAAHPGRVGHSLGIEIGRSIANGEETLRVRLNPHELGRVEVTLAFDDTGSVRATVSAETQRALDLLRNDSGELSRALDQAGVRSDAQSFRFESRTGGGNGQPGAQRHPTAPDHARTSGIDDALQVPGPDYRPIRGDGRVDLLA